MYVSITIFTGVKTIYTDRTIKYNDNETFTETVIVCNKSDNNNKKSIKLCASVFQRFERRCRSIFRTSSTQRYYGPELYLDCVSAQTLLSFVCARMFVCACE